MIPYLLVFLLILYLTIVYDIGKRKRGKTMWQWTLVFALIIMAGLRYHVGSDTIGYEETFKETPELGKLRIEGLLSQPLWMLSLSFCKSVFGSFVSFQFYHAIFLNLLLFRFLRKTTSYIFSSLLVIFVVVWWNLSFEVLRESLCIAIYLNAVLFLRERRYFMYLLLGIIMVGFHWFAFAIVAITPFMLFTNLRWSFPIIGFGAIYLFFFVDEFFFDMLEIYASDVFTGDSLSRVNAYLGKDEGEGKSALNLFGMLRILFTSLVLPIFIVYYGKKDPQTKDFGKILILCILIGILQTKLVIFARFFNYLNCITIVCVVNLIYMKSVRPMAMRFLFKFAFLFFIVNGFMSFYLPSYNEHRPYVHYNCTHIPYRTIFEEPDPIRESM